MKNLYTQPAFDKGTKQVWKLDASNNKDLTIDNTENDSETGKETDNSGPFSRLFDRIKKMGQIAGPLEEEIKENIPDNDITQEQIQNDQELQKLLESNNLNKSIDLDLNVLGYGEGGEITWVTEDLQEANLLNGSIDKSTIVNLLNNKEAQVSWTRENGGKPENSPRYVLAVQAALKMLGENPGKIDALWGNNTENALGEFQEKNGLKNTGYPSVKTLQKLAEVLKAYDGAPSVAEVTEETAADITEETVTPEESNDTENKTREQLQAEANKGFKTKYWKVLTKDMKADLGVDSWMNDAVLVETIQSSLQDQNLYNYKIDKWAGEKTKAAMDAYIKNFDVRMKTLEAEKAEKEVKTETTEGFNNFGTLDARESVLKPIIKNEDTDENEEPEVEKTEFSEETKRIMSYDKFDLPAIPKRYDAPKVEELNTIFQTKITFLQDQATQQDIVEDLAPMIQDEIDLYEQFKKDLSEDNLGKYEGYTTTYDFTGADETPATEEVLEEKVEEKIQDLLTKYESKGWVSQENSWGKELKPNEIYVSEPVRGEDPLFEYKNDMFYPVNYPGSYKPMSVEEFENHIKTTTHRNEHLAEGEDNESVKDLLQEGADAIKKDLAVEDDAEEIAEPKKEERNNADVEQALHDQMAASVNLEGEKSSVKMNISQDAINKAKEYGITIKENELSIDDIDFKLVFEEDTKSVSGSFQNGNVVMNIEDKDGSKHELIIAPNSILYDGEEARFPHSEGEKTIAEIRTEKLTAEEAAEEKREERNKEIVKNSDGTTTEIYTLNKPGITNGKYIKSNISADGGSYNESIEGNPFSASAYNYESISLTGKTIDIKSAGNDLSTLPKKLPGIQNGIQVGLNKLITKSDISNNWDEWNKLAKKEGNTYKTICNIPDLNKDSFDKWIDANLIEHK